MSEDSPCSGGLQYESERWLVRAEAVHQAHLTALTLDSVYVEVARRLAAREGGVGYVSSDAELPETVRVVTIQP